MDVRSSIGERMEQMGEQVGGRLDEMSRHEGKATRQIERVTSAMPTSAWLIAAGASIVGSLILKASHRDATANFVGQWAPTFLILGLYNKLVKLAGSDRGR